MKKIINTKISIITPTFNRKLLLLRLWFSLKTQKFSNFEWIIIDDGSTDNTETEIKKIKDERIKYFKQVNKGVNSARLNGETKIDSKSKFVIYIDSDDAFYSDETIQELFNCISETDNSIALVFFTSVNGNTEEVVTVSPEKVQRIKYLDNLRGEKFVGDAIGIQKIETLKDASWPRDISGCEFLRHWALNKKYDFLSVNKPGKKYFRDRDDNLTSPKMTVKRSKSIIDGIDLAIENFSKDLIEYAKTRYSNLLYSRIIYSSFCENKINTIKKIALSYKNLSIRQNLICAILFILLILPRSFIIKIYLFFSKYKYSN